MKARITGIGLVELMISVLLGSLLIAAMLSLFLSQQRLSVQIEASTALAERMNFASDFLYRHLLEAGYAGPEEQAPYPVGRNGSDQRLADALVIYSQGGRGCTDGQLENSEGVEWRRFTLLREGERRELRCEDSEGGPYPVMDGIEAMQVLYGVDANNDAAPDYYVNLANLPDGAAIVSLRVGLVIRAEASLGSPAEGSGRAMALLDTMLTQDPGRGIDFSDGRLRRSVVVTVALRNKMT